MVLSSPLGPASVCAPTPVIELAPELRADRAPVPGHLCSEFRCGARTSATDARRTAPPDLFS
ncbi:hypothetical protein RCH16_000883 [Cryobacterium sp. MP_M5]|uniref:hypothetical protein n=1 Tax=unclassified Cryobacterium TaxID=2649013 RepID=UPI0018CB5447|nr:MULTISPECIES: hypothetical protein [unclassified Cryobacterium]MBG6057595.1 hypothetical protein [Cryobacterium sp. MP_M3]MEC5175890.1 hypothetical protein [Cryobacterium sp. MP_M5]